MKGNGRRDKTRRYIILTLYIVAVLFAVAAVVYEPNRAFYAAIAGYDMLFLVSYFVTSLAQNVPNSGKYMLLSFSVCLLFAVIIALLYLLFFSRMKEAKTEVTEVPPEEIRIPSAPQVMGTVWIMDDASPHLQDASESEATPTDTDEEPVLVIPADDAEDTTLLTDDSQIKAEDTAIPEDSTLPESADFIDIPDVPVFTEAIIKTEEITADVVLVPPETEKISEVPSTPTFTETILTLDKTTATVSLITFPDKPFMLEPIVEIGEAKIPSAPSIIEPNAIISEEAAPAITPEPIKETSNDDFFSGLSPEEADFWADFYIAGEDELELADGIYYMDLYVNDAYFGAVEVEMRSDVAYIETDGLFDLLNGFLTENAMTRIFANAGDQISIYVLDSLVISAVLNTSAYEIDLTISGEDMPLQVLSLSGRGSARSYRPISGAITLDPAVFMIASRYQLSVGLGTLAKWAPGALDFHFSSINNARLYDVYLDFSYYMDFGIDWFRFRLGNYVFYTDFMDEMIRLRWGNISTDLLSPNGTSVGVEFDKSLSYAHSKNRSRGSQIDKVITIDKESDVTVYNGDIQIFRRTLQPGQYRLEDFTLYTGANRIRIVVDPLDGTEETEIVMDVNYSYSLLAPGEIYYGASIATGRKKVYSSSDLLSGALHIPFGDYWLEYDARNVAISGYINAGLTPTISLNSTFAFSNRPEKGNMFNPSLAAAFQLTHANLLGTTRYNLNLTEEDIGDDGFTVPQIYARIGHQISTDWKYLNGINISGTYNGDNRLTGYNNNLQFSLGFSGSFGKIGYSLNGNYSFDVPYDSISYSASMSVYMNIIRNFTVNASIDVSGYENDPVNVGWSVYGSYRFGKGSVSANASENSYSVDASVTTGKHSFTASADTTDITKYSAYGFDASYAFNGDYVGVGIYASTEDEFRRTNLNLNLSTSTLFADGLFTIGRTIPSNFLLVKQEGALKGNVLSFGAAGNSLSSELPSLFNTSIYTGIPYSGGTSFSLFSSSDSAFGTTSSFDFNIPESDIRGYTARISADNKYSATAVVYMDNGQPWTNGASPVYEMTISEDGIVSLESTDLYLFTDSDGRFIISELNSGLYAFDISQENGWNLGFFEVSDDEDHIMDVQSLVMSDYVESLVLPAEYVSSTYFEFSSYLTSEAFWNLLYPQIGEAV